MAAAVLGIVAAVLVLWLLANGLFANGQANELVQMVLAVVVEFAAIYVVTVLWRRGRKHAAIDAHAAVLSDPRRRVPICARSRTIRT